MNKIRYSVFIFLLFTFLSPGVLFAQVTGTGGHFDMTDFPQWSRDLRRGSIIAFGAFPFAYLIATWGFDFYRFANNGWDRRFAPFPITEGGGVSRTQEDLFMTVGLTAGVAVVIAVIDHAIVRSRRNRLAREQQALQEETQIIIRRSSDGLEDESPDSENLENEVP